MANGTIPKLDAFTNAMEIVANTDLDNLNTPGMYRCSLGTIAVTLSHCPHTTSAFALMIVKALTENGIQILFTGEKIYARRFANNVWGAWYLYTGVQQ